MTHRRHAAAVTPPADFSDVYEQTGAKAEPGAVIDLEAEARATLAGRFVINGITRHGRHSMDFAASDANGRLVLLSVLERPSVAESEARLRRRLAALVKLKHPDIVPLLTFDITPRLLWFATATAARATPLDAFLRDRGPLGLPFTIPLVQNVAAALDHAHRHGIVHGRVCPGTIMVDSEGAAAITGFAFADLPAAAIPSGSESFAAPECAFTRRLTPAADQYSLAATMCECLTSSPSITALHAGEPQAARKPAGAASVQPDLPVHVKQALERAMRLHPRHRFAALRDFAAALTPADPLVQRAPYEDLPPVLFVEAEGPPGRVRRNAAAALLAALAVWAVVRVLPAANESGRRSASGAPPPMAELKPIVPLQPRVTESGSPLEVVAPDLRVQPVENARGRYTDRARSSPQSRGIGGPGANERATARSAPQRTGARAQSTITSGPESSASAADAEAQPARLFISSRPWGHLSVDGQPAGTTPRSDLPLTPGRHRVRVTRAGFLPFERDIVVESGQKLQLIDIILKESTR